MKQKIIKTTDIKKNDFVLYGLVSSANDYRIAWLLNNKLNIKLKKADDFTIEIKKLSEITNYTQFSTEDNPSNIRFISNKDANSLKLFKLDFDYILIINKDCEYVDNIKNYLSQINEIMLSSKIQILTKHNKKILEKIHKNL